MVGAKLIRSLEELGGGVSLISPGQLKINSHTLGLVEKIGGLGLVDHEAAKTSLLCKWIVKALELGEYDLQLVLRYG